LTRDFASEVYLKKKRQPWTMKGDPRRKRVGRAVNVLESDEIVQTDEKGADGSDETEGGWSGSRVVNLTGGHSRESRKTLLEGGAGQDSWTTWAQRTQG
jgi:hypothetical protein